MQPLPLRRWSQGVGGLSVTRGARWQSRARTGQERAREGAPRCRVPGATSRLAQPEHRPAQCSAAGCWRLPTACLGGRGAPWQQNRFSWSCRSKNPEEELPTAPRSQFAFWATFTVAKLHAQRRPGCRADISTPPSCLSPPRFISKQQRRGRCLASRGAQ